MTNAVPIRVARSRPTRCGAARPDGGFTLIELLVVVIVIGLLAAIATPVFLNQRRKAVDSMLRADVRSMAMAQETWLTENPREPGTVDAAALAEAGFKKSSPQVRIMVALNTSRNGYCIAAHHRGSSTPETWHYMVYDSLAGGLMNQGRMWDWSGSSPPGSSACWGAGSTWPFTTF